MAENGPSKKAHQEVYEIVGHYPDLPFLVLGEFLVLGSFERCPFFPRILGVR